MIPRTWSVVLVIAAAVAPYAGPAANAQAPAPTKPDAAPAATPPPVAPRPAVMKAKRFESTEAATQAFVWSFLAILILDFFLGMVINAVHSRWLGEAAMYVNP